MNTFGWIIVCGGRRYDDFNHVSRTLWELEAARGRLSIRHGGANGADSLADRWAASTGHEVKPVFADWLTHRKAAGAIRNGTMLKMLPAVKLVVAFPGGAGTADMVRQARRAGVEIMIVPAHPDYKPSAGRDMSKVKGL